MIIWSRVASIKIALDKWDMSEFRNVEELKRKHLKQNRLKSILKISLSQLLRLNTNFSEIYFFF